MSSNSRDETTHVASTPLQPARTSSSTSTGKTTWKEKSISASKCFSKLLPLLGPSQDSAGSSSRSMSSTTASSAAKKSKLEKERERATEREQLRRRIAARRQESDLRAAQVESPEQRARYGDRLPYDWAAAGANVTSLTNVTDALAGQRVTLRGRLHAKRSLGSHLAFIVLRQQLDTLQCVVSEHVEDVPLHMVRWIERIPVESIIVVRGKLVVPKTQERSTHASISGLELTVDSLYVESQPTVSLPFSVYQAERSLAVPGGERESDESEEEGSASDSTADNQTPSHAGQAESPSAVPRPHRPPAPPSYAVVSNLTRRVRLENRILDLRTPASQAIFRIQSAVCTAFRSALLADEFIEIHTPKLQSGSSESGSSVFAVDYFGRPAYLAQSPQLYKQICVAGADMKRVFEVAPVFRAELSNTKRHLAEFTGLDLEMEIVHYHEAMHLIDSVLKRVFRTILAEYTAEMDIVRRQFASGKAPVILAETPIIDFVDGVRMLRDSEFFEDDGSLTSFEEDLSSGAERRLCELVEEKTTASYFILDHFPASARPFYTMPDPSNPSSTLSFDIFLCGAEISSGGQRIHDASMLEASIKRAGLDARDLSEYLEAFRLGANPHAGCGIGLERLVTTFLGLGDVRWASLFHRDPKSLPAKSGPTTLRDPEVDTLAAAGAPVTEDAEVVPPFPLPSLIANYGDSSNTSWLDERFSIYRQPHSGAAVGYVVQGKHIVIVGNPLCDASQYRSVVEDFLTYVSRLHGRRPIWLLVDENMERILASRFNWTTLSCVVEQRVPVRGRDAILHGDEIERKIRKAEREGLKLEQYLVGEGIPDATRDECDRRIADWRQSRQGQQLHLTEVLPFNDKEHRAYFICRDSTRVIQAMVVLAQLAPANGYQVKWALDFPGSANSAIEWTLAQAMHALPKSPLTFGAAASSELQVMHGMGALRKNALSKTFQAIVETAHLENKRSFRTKLSTETKRLFIAYPRHGLKAGGIKAIMKFFGE